VLLPSDIHRKPIIFITVVLLKFVTYLLLSLVNKSKLYLINVVIKSKHLQSLPHDKWCQNPNAKGCIGDKSCLVTTDDWQRDS
jgi:hypothetical protein